MPYRTCAVKAALIAAVAIATPASVLKAQQPAALQPPTKTKAIRLPDRTGIRLPDGAQVNAAMFEGLVLNESQGRAIVAFAEAFAAERVRLLGDGARKPWSADTQRRMAPFLEKQRLAYRSVLLESQRARFDANAARILSAWRNRSAPAGDSRTNGGR